MAIILQAPSYNGDIKVPSIFLAGGISNCPNWQDTVIRMLYPIRKLAILNPRRDSFDIENRHMAIEQIEWEHDHLKLANMILFWFSEGSINPITLFEYGRWGRLGQANSGVPVFVGCHPNYVRKFDVEIQTALDSGPTIHNSIESLTSAVLSHLKSINVT